MTETGQSPTSTPAHGPPLARVQVAAILIAGMFVVIGILGFIPGVTSGFSGTGGMGFSGLNSRAELFGLFRVSVLHNGIHLMFGLVGAICSFTPQSARAYLFVGGTVYLILGVYGFVIDHDTDANFVPINTAGNWLHLALGAGMIAVGVATGRERR